MKVADLFQRLFPPFEVRVTCHDIKALLRADNGLCMDIVMAEALALAKNADRTVYSIRISQMKPDQLALTLIFNVLTRRLQSGSQHVYRGMLSIIGRDMLRLWHVTAKELITRGYSTQEEYEADVKGLTEEIRSVG